MLAYGDETMINLIAPQNIRLTRDNLDLQAVRDRIDHLNTASEGWFLIFTDRRVKGM